MTSPRTVHVVDDNNAFRQALSRLLRAAGFEVRDYASVAAFIDSAHKGISGCVVTDLRMPQKSGLELQRLLRQLDDTVPLIFVSAHGDIPTTVRAMRDGAVDFLTKPVRKEALLDAVESALQRFASQCAQRDALNALRARFASLTPRETEVMTHVIAGNLNKQIASDLGTAERTVKAHRASVMRKLQVQSVAELVRLCETMHIQPAARYTGALLSESDRFSPARG